MMPGASQRRPVSSFFAAYFCLVPFTDLSFAVVSHCATVPLKRLALGGLDATSRFSDAEVHRRIGFDGSSPFLVPAASMAEFETTHGARQRFAVWRDPVERLASVYERFVIRGDENPYFEWSGLGDATPDRFVDFVTYELGKPDPLRQDEHLRRQCDSYDPATIGQIVEYGRLGDFLDAHGLGLRPDALAGALDSERVGDGVLLRDPTLRKRLERLYAADLDLARGRVA